jgi:WD40 repeat protein
MESEKFKSISKLLVKFNKQSQKQPIIKEVANNNPRLRRYKALPEFDNNENDGNLTITLSNLASSQSSEIFSRRSYAEIEISKMPPFNHKENACFALSSVCGPSSGPIQVLAVHTNPETGQIVAATSGGEDRSQKMICIWDIRKDELISQLDNSTIKPVTCLKFHPSFPNLLLSADISCDIKLWNWNEGKVIRWWKKHHSRIIFQIEFIPGDDTR